MDILTAKNEKDESSLRAPTYMFNVIKLRDIDKYNSPDIKDVKHKNNNDGALANDFRTQNEVEN